MLAPIRRDDISRTRKRTRQCSPQQTEHGRGLGMTNRTRRSLLQGGAALTGTLALGFPAIVRAQTDKIKIGHLTPLTGFLGALGAYAQLGMRMAEEEIHDTSARMAPR